MNLTLDVEEGSRFTLIVDTTDAVPVPDEHAYTGHEAPPGADPEEYDPDTPEAYSDEDEDPLVLDDEDEDLVNPFEDEDAEDAKN